MNYWWVNHKKTHKEEREGGYIWSPKSNSNGGRNETYINLTKVAPGDFVFSYANGQIGAIGIVVKYFKEEPKPLEFGQAGESWANIGWIVPINWHAVTPFKPKDDIVSIVPLLPEKHSPIRNNGDGNQGCYLSSISTELGRFLFNKLSSATEHLDIEVERTYNLVEEELEQSAIEQSPSLSTTEKEQIVNARRGQGLFRKNVMRFESRCRITHISRIDLLIASHIKPWRLSNNPERLDGANGLMLAPHVDKLFDSGLITFSDDGQIISSSVQIDEVLRKWAIDKNKNVGKFTKKQVGYLDFHRQNIFKCKE